MTDAGDPKPQLGHKECSECYNRILDLTGFEYCNECGGAWF